MVPLSKTIYKVTNAFTMTPTNRIEITGGYVNIREYATRKISREYLNLISEHSEMKEDGSLAITPKAVNIASEYLVCEMIEGAFILTADGTEKEIEVNKDWLDELREKDFTKISDVVLKIFNDGRKASKK